MPDLPLADAHAAGGELIDQAAPYSVLAETLGPELTEIRPPGPTPDGPP